MFLTGWMATSLFCMIASLDKRARPMVCVLVLCCLQSVFSEQFLRAALEDSRLMEIVMKIPIDIGCGLLAVMVAERERWSQAVPALFGVTLLVHAGFWLTYYNGVDTWALYANSLSVLFALQAACNAIPGGGQLIGRLRAGLGYIRSWRRSLNNDDAVKARAFVDFPSYLQGNRRTYVRPNCGVFLPEDKRA